MKTQVPNKLSKKVARLQVKEALSSLSDLQSSLGKKKFERRMRKVEKILSQGLPKVKKEKNERAETEL